MKPIFTVHAGEYLAGSHIEENFKNCRVWIPSKDTGIDLLVSNRNNTKALSLQVKFSKDFAQTHMADFYKDKLIASTWFKFAADKINSSEADYWLFVVRPFAGYASSFMLIKPRNLLRRIRAIHGKKDKYDLYFTITKDKRCYETRGLNDGVRRKIVLAPAGERKRDFTDYLDDWSPLDKLNNNTM